MATEAQIAANRQNALKSTGPTTPEGKAKSSKNRVTHSLAGSTTSAFMAERDRELIDQRKADWRKEYAPETPDEEWLYEVMVTESIRVDRCRDAYFAGCTDHGRRARTHWEADRRNEANALTLRLARSPHVVAHQIQATRQGAELMIELWRGIAASLEKNKTWTDAQRSLALDLLGVHPELRDAETPLDPAEGDAFEARRAVVSREVARLESLRDGRLADRDGDERAMAEATLGAELTRPLQLLDRYERAAWNRQRWAMRKLREARLSREAAPPPPRRPKAAPPPAPRPVSRPQPEPAEPRPSSTVRVAASATPELRLPSRLSADLAAVERVTSAAAPRPMNRRQRRAEAARARAAAH